MISRRAVLARGAQAGALAVIGAPSLVGAASEKTITIGGTVPLSGPVAAVGRNTHDGYMIAAEQINKLGGFKIGNELYRVKLDLADDQSDPQRAVTLVQKQLDAGVNFFLGSYTSPVTIPMVALIERNNKLVVQAGGSSDVLYTQGYRNNFCIYPRASRQGAAIGGLAKAAGGIKACTIIGANDPQMIPVAGGVAKALEENGIKVAETHRVAANAVDFSTVLASVKSNPSDMLLLAVHEQQARTILQQMISTSANVKALWMQTGPETEAFRQTFGKYSEQLLYLTFWFPDLDLPDPVFGSNLEFVKLARAKDSGREPSHQTISAATCLTVYGDAFRRAGSLDLAKVRDAVRETDLMTAFGRVKFSPEGDADPVISGAKVGQVQAGKPRMVFPRIQGAQDLQYPMKSWTERA